MKSGTKIDRRQLHNSAISIIYDFMSAPFGAGKQENLLVNTSVPVGFQDSNGGLVKDRTPEQACDSSSS